MKPTLVITRGLPASGKSKRAKTWVAEDVVRRARVNRDDVRRMLHGGRLGTKEQEMMVNKVRDAAVARLLKGGISVVCDDTNLQQRWARELRRLAVLHGAEFEVWDLTDVPLDVCIDRDSKRSGDEVVGKDAIRDMHKRFLAGKPYPLPFPEESVSNGSVPDLYVPDTDLPTAVMVDIDGTVALMAGRSAYDETRVHEDRPNQPVIDAVRMVQAAGHRIVFLSGRTNGCYGATVAWLVKHVTSEFDGPFMRAENDMRKDAIVKLELFNEHVRDKYNVKFVFDDRDQVIAAWRSIGLTAMQVAPGDF